MIIVIKKSFDLKIRKKLREMIETDFSGDNKNSLLKFYRHL